jgi:hypothetical protein
MRCKSWFVAGVTAWAVAVVIVGGRGAVGAEDLAEPKAVAPAPEVLQFFERSEARRKDCLDLYSLRAKQSAERLAAARKGPINKNWTDREESETGPKRFVFTSAAAKKARVAELEIKVAESQEAAAHLKAGTGWPMPWIDYEVGDIGDTPTLAVGRIGRFLHVASGVKVRGPDSISWKPHGTRPVLLKGIDTTDIADDESVRLGKLLFEVVGSKPVKNVYGDKNIYYLIERIDEKKINEALKPGHVIIEWPDRR